MPLGAAHRASIEDKMRSERSKELGENLYSTGFGAYRRVAQASPSGSCPASIRPATASECRSMTAT